MMSSRPSSGLIANCTLEPPVSTPISRRHAIDALRMIWYSLSVSVCAGATVIESPVCTPIGSRFSIEQMMMQLSLLVAHHLHLELFPAEHRFLDQHLAGRARVEPALHHGAELFLVVRDAAASTAQRERRTDDGRKTHHGLHLQRLFEAVRDRRARARQPDLRHRRLELFAVLGLVDRFLLRAYHFDAVFLEHAVSREIERAIQCRLPAHRRQQRVRPLDRDHLLDHLPGDGLDVGRVRHVGIGHDRRRVRIDEDHAIALLAQRLARLRAGVIEFARLADDDRAGADDQDALDVGAFGHEIL